jgi:hypothetical protein
MGRAIYIYTPGPHTRTLAVSQTQAGSGSVRLGLGVTVTTASWPVRAPSLVLVVSATGRLGLETRTHRAAVTHARAHCGTHAHAHSGTLYTTHGARRRSVRRSPHGSPGVTVSCATGPPGSSSLGRPSRPSWFFNWSWLRVWHWQFTQGTEPPIPIPIPIPDLPGIGGPAGDRGWTPDPRLAGDRGSTPIPIPDLPGIGGPLPGPSPSPISSCQNRGSS